jgi:glutamate/aspartate transport system substrate-binding protein
VDLLCSATSDTKERREAIAFSLPIYLAAVKVLVKSGSGINSLAQLQDQPIVVIGGTSAEHAVLDHEPTMHWRLLQAHDDKAALGQLKLGWASGYARDDVMLVKQVSQLARPLDYLILEDPLATESIALAFQKGDSEFAALVDSALAEAMASGTAESLYQRWFTQSLAADGKNPGMPMSAELKAAYGL